MPATREQRGSLGGERQITCTHNEHKILLCQLLSSAFVFFLFIFLTLFTGLLLWII